jgi:hypothetical protein
MAPFHHNAPPATIVRNQLPYLLSERLSLPFT